MEKDQQMDDKDINEKHNTVETDIDGSELVEADKVVINIDKNYKTESSETEGSETEGSETEGSETEGSETESSETEGSETVSSETEGSETESSETVSSETVSSETENSVSEATKTDILGNKELSHKGFDKFKTLNKTIVFINTFWNDRNLIPKRTLYIPLLFFIGFLIYMEIVLHLLLYRSIDIKIIYPIIFAIPAGTLLTLLTGFLNRTANKIMIWSLTGIISLVFCVQLIYFKVFKLLFSFQSLGMAGDAFSEFGSDVITAIKGNMVGMLLLLIPIPFLIFLMNRFFDWDKRDRKRQGILLTGSIFLHIMALITLLFFGKGDFTPYDLYHNSKVHDLCGKQLGILTLTRLDVGKLIIGEEKLALADAEAIQWDVIIEPTIGPTMVPTITPMAQRVDPDATPTPSPPPTPTPIDTSPNILNIDFAALADKEKDDTVKMLHRYFDTIVPTNKNQYSGMFEGYNLIMITAEGFSPYAVHKEKTPTLYRLVNEGFVFIDFYTALWQTSTSDGEYVPMTGLIPVGTRSMYHSRNNLWPFSLGHQFNRLGLESKAYHNHTHTYYQRNETHPNLGYDFKALKNGLVLEHDVWPNSDLEMINATVDEFIGEEQFHVYYLTVSGHMNYTFIGNSMSYKNMELVKDLPYSSDCRAYIACQMELDMALEQLIHKLEEAGVADRTVIALSADHYPYGWEKDKLDELAGHEVESSFEVYKNHFILWNAGMKESIIVDKTCSSLDILPTLSNLFGLEYDSRLMMGQDVLSDSEPLVILANRSFITDKVMYNSETQEVILRTDEELPVDYIINKNKVIKNKFTVSQSIVKKDYYRYVLPDLLEAAFIRQ